LEEYFKHLVDIAFTAKMEDALDAISRGEQESLPYLTEFYRGSGDLPGLKDLLGAEIDARTACTIPLPGQEDRQPPHITVRIGKYGPYLERETERAPLPAILSPDELTLETAADLLRRGSQPDVLGQDPESGKSVYLKNGRFGPYVQLGETGEEPKMKSLLPGQTPEDISLEAALRLLSLPRTVGTDPETGEPIIADLGRFGPYLRRGAPEKKETRTLPTPEAVFTLTLEEAQALLLLPKYGKGSARGAATILKELGPHPQSGAVITVRSGRYGPYTTDGEVNASLPRGEAPEGLTLERAVELLTARAAAAPARKGRRGAKKTAGASKKTTAASPGRKPKTAARAKEALPGSIDAGETAAAPKKPSVRKAGTRKKS
ncbi:MAG: DNA topoisomerase I, partial [Deltaproteobacteria bacterium]|nr:DNA topoisomerase I [Deltaproteobacteria bacterium]